MGKYDWPDIARCDDPSDPTPEEVYRRLQAVANSGAPAGILTLIGIDFLKVEGEPETRIVATQEAAERIKKSVRGIDNGEEPCYHIDMTQPNSIFSHADVPVDPEYLQRVAAEHAGISDTLIFNDGTVEQGYDPETLRALRDAALQHVNIPMPNFSSPETQRPISAPAGLVEPVKFSHAKQHKPRKIVKSDVDQTAVFKDGGTISHAD